MKLLIFVFSFNLNNKLNDLIVRSLVRNKSQGFNDIHNNSYMEVSNETSDNFFTGVVMMSGLSFNFEALILST